MAHRTTTLLCVFFFVGTPALARAPDEAESVTEPKNPPSPEPEGAAGEATDAALPSESDESPAERAETSGSAESPGSGEPALPSDPGEPAQPEQSTWEFTETSEPTDAQPTSGAAVPPPPPPEESIPQTRAAKGAPAAKKGATSDKPPQEGVKLQKPFARQGEFVALGAHFGMATADDKDYGIRKPSFGPAFTLRLGEAIVDWADIGLEFGFGLQAGKEKLTSGRIIAHTRLYPMERFFIHTGFGFGFAGGPDPEEPAFKRFRYGDVYVLGIGANLYLRDRNKSGGPMFSPSVTFELGPDREFTTGVAWLGAEFSWWSGLRRHQLDLPIDDAYSRSPGD